MEERDITIVRISTTVSRGYLLRKTKTLASLRLCVFALKKSVFIRENPCPKVQQERDMEERDITIVRISTTVNRGYLLRKTKTLASLRLCVKKIRVPKSKTRYGNRGYYLLTNHQSLFTTLSSLPH